MIHRMSLVRTIKRAVEPMDRATVALLAVPLLMSVTLSFVRSNRINACSCSRLNAAKMVDTVALVARRVTFTREAANPRPHPHFNSIIDFSIDFIFLLQIKVFPSIDCSSDGE